MEIRELSEIGSLMSIPNFIVPYISFIFNGFGGSQRFLLYHDSTILYVLILRRLWGRHQLHSAPDRSGGTGIPKAHAQKCSRSPMYL